MTNQSKFFGILTFEVRYQLRHPATWLLFGAFFLFGFAVLRLVTLVDGTYLNAPATIVFFSVFASAIWVVMGGVVAGDAATRDVSTGMHPLTYTAPVTRFTYLGARFLAAFALNLSIMLSLYAGFLVSFYGPGARESMLGPFRLASYLSGFGMILLPTVTVITAVQFALSTLSRRAIASYVASILIILFSQFAGTTVRFGLDWKITGSLMDLLGTSIVAEMEGWTPLQQNTQLILPKGLWLWNRIVWLTVAAAALVYMYSRFKPTHVTGRQRWIKPKGSKENASVPPTHDLLQNQHETALNSHRSPAYSLRHFQASAQLRQVITIAGSSFRVIATSRAGLALVAVLAAGTGLFATEYMEWFGVSLLARTEEVLRVLTPPLSSFRTQWIIIPLLIIFYAGELVWREHDARLNELSDTAPVPEWVMFTGKLGGLVLMIAVWVAFMLGAGILNQVVMGYHDFEPDVYLRAMFGIQFVNYALFAALMVSIHVIVNHKYIGHMVAIAAYGFIMFAPMMGVEHRMLVYASDSGWSYSDMRGFGPHIKPWIWFKAYWFSFALVMGFLATSLWVRSRETSIASRVAIAKDRISRQKVAFAMAVMLFLLIGGNVFYNTNIRHPYVSKSKHMALRAEYERRYSRFSDTTQPLLAGVKMYVDLFPDDNKGEIRGTYQLVNQSQEGIDSIHLTTNPSDGLEPAFDRKVFPVVLDDDHGYRIYSLETPLNPGDSLEMTFTIAIETQGFTHYGVQTSVATNGSHIDSDEWMPVIGYDDDRRLHDPQDRRTYGLPERSARPSPHEAATLTDTRHAQPIRFEAVVGTSKDQIAVAPGSLQRTWTSGDRRWFHYAAKTPIFNEYAFFSARYAVKESTWTPPDSTGSGQPVTIQIYHHPSHNANIERMMESIHASLTYYSREFGPYPHHLFRVLERPGPGRGMHAEPMTIDYQEGYSLMNPSPGDLQLPYHIMAHEVAHQWWGFQLAPAPVEGAGLLVESLATFSAMQVVEEDLGPDHLQKYLTQMRQEYEVPRSRAAPPLLRSNNRFMNYRKGPFALFALRNYSDTTKLNEALRKLLQKHSATTPPLPTTLDLYREMKSTTPDSLHYLLHDLFAANTFWELEAREAVAKQTGNNQWQVSLSFDARKTTVDSLGTETAIPMNDWVEVGVYSPREGDKRPEELYRQFHRIHSGRQRIVVDVSGEPGRAGIDPRHLLIDLDLENNTTKVNHE